MRADEQALLGILLGGLKDLPAVARIIGRNDFEDFNHQEIWDAVLAVHGAGLTVSPLTVADRLGKDGVLVRVGGAPYLHTLLAQPYAEPLWLADQIRDARVRREVDSLGDRCKQLKNDLDKTPEDLVAQIRTWADGITTSKGEVSGIEAALEAVIEVAEHGEALGIPTPWAGLNELLDGAHPGQLITLAARPGVGKSIALENWATDIARGSGTWVLMASLEMSPKEITQRTMAHTARVSLSKIRRGAAALSEIEWQAMSNAAKQISATRIEFADQSLQTVASIRADAWDTAQKAKRRGERLGAVVVDYIQLVSPPREQGLTRQQKIGEVTRGLKQMARELEVPVITAAQLRRIPTPRPPVLDDLREAGDIENDSDVVVLLHEEEVDEGGRTIKTENIEAIVAKNRNGPQGSRMLHRYGSYARLFDGSVA